MQSKRSKKRLFLVIALAAVIIIALAGMVAARKREKPIPVTTDKAFRKSVTQLVTATGKIQPEVEGKIAPEVSGEIVEIPEGGAGGAEGAAAPAHQAGPVPGAGRVAAGGAQRLALI